MDILKRIDQAQQFCTFYADGAYSVETEKWNHHVNPEFIEDIRQYIESLQLKLMYLQTQQAHKAVCKSESYDMIDRFLRNNLYDDDYDSYSEALHEVATTPPAAQWERTSASFNDWWDSNIMPPSNPFAEGSAAYWAWAGWQAAQRPWQGLTNKEIAEILCDDRWQMRPELMLLACQAKLKERNT
jgi:hypothetical protein